MTQDALIYIPGASEGTTQWKAETLQMVNWGGFHGPSTVTFAPSTTLLSGASGTGKSTLLDAYLALMMPSDTQFNSASNDMTLGRARAADQRNLLSYLRGKMDTNRDTGTNELTDQVLRGADGPTWGAIAMTFVNDRDARFTVLRAYYVPRNATNQSGLTMKLATMDGSLRLKDLEPLAAAKFDKRSLKARFPTIEPHDTYSQFAQTLYTRLGIGANADGAKALRLLARIQAGHQVRTVDDLYKSMVIEQPATYEAADRAVEHFVNLEASYLAMQTEADKQRVLSRLPELNTERTAALNEADLIDAFGVQRDSGSPFLLWRYTREDALLEAAEDANRAAKDHQSAIRKHAIEDEERLEELHEAAKKARDDAGGDAIRTIETKLELLGPQHDSAVGARTRFDAQTRVLDLSLETGADFTQATLAAEAFLSGFVAANGAVAQERQALGQKQYPLMAEKKELNEERASLQGRDGLVPRHLDGARRLVAQTLGMHPEEVPFVAELLDIAPQEARWRKAIETQLFGLARVMLVDRQRLAELRRAIDPLRLPLRLNFEGVPLHQPDLQPSDSRYISGKLLYRDSPFTGWLQGRITRDDTDAFCVETAADLTGDDLRITLKGQTGRGNRGAHGDYKDPYIIGFSNKERLGDIERRLQGIENELKGLESEDRAIASRAVALLALKAAHEAVLNTTWAAIDADGIRARINELEGQRERLRTENPDFARLESEAERLKKDLKAARNKGFTAGNALKQLEEVLNELIARKDRVYDRLREIDEDSTVTLTEENATYLDEEFAKVTDPTALGQFSDGIGRLKRRLGDHLIAARSKVRSVETTMTGIFQTYLDRWEDPNLDASITNYANFRDILDNILQQGLHERREEWTRNLAEWSGQDLVPLAGAFSEAISDIKRRLTPVNDILEHLPFGARRERLQIHLRELHREEVTEFRAELNRLAKGATADLTEADAEAWFQELQRFMSKIRKPEPGRTTKDRDNLLDVRKHVEITAVAIDSGGRERATYAALGGKSGGETQELVAFVVGAALRYQLGDDAAARPRYAPVFLDEGFVKSDSEFAGRAVNAWQGLGFQLIIGAPLDKVTALEPHSETILTVVKSTKGYSRVVHVPSRRQLAGGTEPGDER